MGGNGRVTVATTHRRAAGRAKLSPPSERSGSSMNTDGAGELVEISVHDTGPGISQKC